MSAPPSPSSSRTTSPTSSTRLPPPPSRRPNRAALRDYYNLKSTPSGDAINNGVQQQAVAASPTRPTHISSPTKPIAFSASSELDTPGFDASAYIRSVLAGEGLEGVLRVEAGLINEIKGLDGERKSLVYDNYSKLISATDTIRRMRGDMGTEMAGRGVLGPAVGHIAETVRGLSQREGGVEGGPGKRGGDGHGGGKGAERRRQRETVRWVIDAPRRLGVLLEEGKRGEAEEEWVIVGGLLGKWEGVSGVEEVKGECERVMGGKG